jgi:hypothetical protein
VEEERVATVVGAEGDGELSLRHPVTDSLLRVRGILVILYLMFYEFLKCFHNYLGPLWMTEKIKKKM